MTMGLYNNAEQDGPRLSAPKSSLKNKLYSDQRTGFGVVINCFGVPLTHFWMFYACLPLIK